MKIHEKYAEELKSLIQQGFTISSFMGYNQVEVVITLSRDGEMLTKIYSFTTPNVQGRFVKIVRRLYYGSS